MNIFSGIFRSRDKPQNRTSGSTYSFFFGGSTAGKRVNERSAMQMTAVYSCVRILAEAGVLVDATDNPQMKCYVLGTLDLFDDIYDIDNVSMTIYQPRRQNIFTFGISKDGLYKWANEVYQSSSFSF